MISRESALELVNSWVQNKNLVKHMLCVEAVMRALAKHFGEDGDIWGIAGLIHDADYEKYPDEHPKVLIKELERRKESSELIQVIKSHAWGYREEFPKPKTKFEWSLYTCDELTGLIVACALVRPDKKLSSVDVAAVQRKWNQKAFAAGVDRSQIEMCEKELGIKLPDFIQIALTAMQGISFELEL